MTYIRLPYEDASTPMQMSVDCHAVEAALSLAPRATSRTVSTADIIGEPPSIAYADFPREIGKDNVSVSEATARLANAMELPLD
jgi:hypothetical protein